MQTIGSNYSSRPTALQQAQQVGELRAHALNQVHAEMHAERLAAAGDDARTAAAGTAGNSGTGGEDSSDSKKAPRAEYSVTNFYKRNGNFFSDLARHSYFEYTTLGVISLNAIWIGIDTDHNDAEDVTTARLEFVIAENFFAFYFVAEVLIRFAAFRKKLDCFRDHWFKFDTVLVAFMVLETWIMPILASAGGGGGAPTGNLSILRLLRLLRLTRMARLMRSVPELLTLIKGMVAATRSVFSTMVLLILSMYVFGIVFTQAFMKDPQLSYMFDCMGMSMLTLFVNGTLLDDLTSVLGEIAEYGGHAYAWVFIVYILLAAFTVLNMLIGVLCEVVTKTAAEEQEAMMIREVQVQLKEVFDEIDEDKSGLISQEEFSVMSKNEIALGALTGLGIEPKHLIALKDTLFALDDGEQPESASSTKKKECDPEPASPHSPWGVSPRQEIGGSKDFNTARSRRKKEGQAEEEQQEAVVEGRELTFDEFLDTVVHLRPGTQASVLDIADLRKGLRLAVKRAERRVNEIEKQMVQNMKTGRYSPAVGNLPANVGPPKEGCKCPTCGKVKKQEASNPQSTQQPSPLQQQPESKQKWKDLANIQQSTKNLHKQKASSYLVVSYEDNVKLPLTEVPTAALLSELRGRMPQEVSWSDAMIGRALGLEGSGGGSDAAAMRKVVTTPVDRSSRPAASAPGQLRQNFWLPPSLPGALPHFGLGAGADDEATWAV